MDTAGARVAAPDVSARGMQELLRLGGRGAVVTGAARGLGRAIAERLAAAGAAVTIGDIDAGAAEEAARALSGAHRVAARGFGVDVRDADSMEALAACGLRTSERIDIWVNNAGIFTTAHPVDATVAEFEAIMRVNTTGTHLGCQVAARHMSAFGGGVIVNVASTAAFQGAGAYSASKWAVRGLTQGLARRLGPRGIRVVAVAPTLVGTPGTDAVRAAGGAAIEHMYDELTASLPLGRAAVPDDVARVVVFLCSDAAAFVTGTTIPVDGGELAS